MGTSPNLASCQVQSSAPLNGLAHKHEKVKVEYLPHGGKGKGKFPVNHFEPVATGWNWSIPARQASFSENLPASTSDQSPRFFFPHSPLSPRYFRTNRRALNRQCVCKESGEQYTNLDPPNVWRV